MVVKLDLSANGHILNFGTEEIDMDLMYATHVRTPSEYHYDRINHYLKSPNRAWGIGNVGHPMQVMM